MLGPPVVRAIKKIVFTVKSNVDEFAVRTEKTIERFWSKYEGKTELTIISVVWCGFVTVPVL